MCFPRGTCCFRTEQNKYISMHSVIRIRVISSLAPEHSAYMCTVILPSS
jgi:hypothetical protein